MQAAVSRWAEIHRKAAEKYRLGSGSPLQLASREDTEFLKACGLSLQVLLDYVEDFVRTGEPDAGTFSQVAEIRRQYFQEIQKGVPSNQVVNEPDLPLRSDEWDGIDWLPRISEKARCFLEGSLCQEVMYGCGGDRAFLRNFHLTLPGFLKMVRDSGQDRGRILASIRRG
ncbi:MAG: hypothetical protein ACOYM3_16760 [Terrimicrobiaceae bacterium]